MKVQHCTAISAIAEFLLTIKLSYKLRSSFLAPARNNTWQEACVSGLCCPSINTYFA